jgi:hypothetical protein
MAMATSRNRKNGRASLNGAKGRAQRSDSGYAFLPDPGDGPALAGDDLAELLAEDYLLSATTGGDANGDEHEVVVDEEFGGPFVETAESDEFAAGTDESNPEDATAEPLPRAMGGPPHFEQE